MEAAVARFSTGSAKPLETVFALGQRIAALLNDVEPESIDGHLPEGVREHIADLVEALRGRVAKKAERDARSLFDLDERFIEVMYRAEEVVSESGQLPEELFAEITDYLEAFRTKVDCIAGYWRWQESIAAICGQEVERLSARKKAAEGRVTRLKNMLLEFMMARGLKRLEGDKTSVALQANSSASLVVDDPLQIGESFFENAIRFTKTELQEIVYQMTDGELRRRLELALEGKGWEINNSATRAAIANNEPVHGARLVKGQHVRLRRVPPCPPA
jgi:hypothetical protein